MAKRMKEKTQARKDNKDTRPCAQAKYIRISPTKVRVVLDTVRGKSVSRKRPYSQGDRIGCG